MQPLAFVIVFSLKMRVLETCFEVRYRHLIREREIAEKIKQSSVTLLMLNGLIIFKTIIDATTKHIKLKGVNIYQRNMFYLYKMSCRPWRKSAHLNITNDVTLQHFGIFAARTFYTSSNNICCFTAEKEKGRISFCSEGENEGAKFSAFRDQMRNNFFIWISDNFSNDWQKGFEREFLNEPSRRCWSEIKLHWQFNQVRFLNSGNQNTS